MTSNAISPQAITTYRDPAQPKYPFCPGCGHGPILDSLNAALVKLQLDPRQVAIVTDIGCSGLSDQYFIPNAFHGLHGRSVTYATGLKLANPDLHVIVIMGDGGCGIGGHHLINAARRNIGVTVLVFNNFNFGMTGGQHSVTTPHGSNTSTTRGGNLERPLDICQTVAVNGANFVARATSFDKNLPDLIAQALTHDGFSLLDIWEMCVAYYVPNNDFSKSALMGLLASLQMPTGIVQSRSDPELSRAYRAAHARVLGKPTLSPTPIPAQYQSRLDRPWRIVIAGAAGQKVRSTATLFGAGAIRAGLWASQRDDYPVTVQSGHSVAELILSPHEIYYTGIPRPDVMIVFAPEGLKVVRRQLAAMTPADTLLIDQALLPVNTAARVVPLGFERLRAGRKQAAMLAVSAALRYLDIYPLNAFVEAIRAGQRAEFAAESLKVLEESVNLIA